MEGARAARRARRINALRAACAAAVRCAKLSGIVITKVWHNGSIRAIGDAGVSPLSAGLLYGWGVFTTLGIVGGSPRHVDRHVARLAAHAERLGIPLEYDAAAFEAALADLIVADSIGDGRARITVVRGSAGPWRDELASPSDVWVLAASIESASRPPLNLTLSPHRVNSASPLVGVKSTAYVAQLLAFEEARQRGFDEAVMLNERGEVVECSSSNIFWVRGGELWTPALGTGCLAGITRALVLEAASRLRIRAYESAATARDLYDADEVFCTSSVRGIQPVSELNMHRYPAPGPVSGRLVAWFGEEPAPPAPFSGKRR